mmetsp:Transcript_31182/g.60136  ORF Transcript_31182/g.60136 Transcript_31182/m.60136 type:complete len:90 (+) Transcript_31182:420-689(+)
MVDIKIARRLTQRLHVLADEVLIYSGFATLRGVRVRPQCILVILCSFCMRRDQERMQIFLSRVAHCGVKYCQKWCASFKSDQASGKRHL